MNTPDTEQFALAAYVLKAIANPIRMRIIKMLENNSLTVTSIFMELDEEQSNVSHHLTNLRDKGILKTHRDGKHIFYTLTDQTFVAVVDTLMVCRPIRTPKEQRALAEA